jgi:hypothetical protein
MPTPTLFSLVLLFSLCLPAPVSAQDIIFAAGFDNTLQSAEGENPANTSGISFTTGVAGEGIRVEAGDILQYAIADNILAEQGSMTLWVRPDWSPGAFLRRILVVESSPVFEMHVDESAAVVLALFGGQIETRITNGNVASWSPGDWHFVAFNWSADRLEIYVDGNQVAETSVGYEIPAFGAGTFHVGSLGGASPFVGTLDELTIYDAPLTSAQISQQYDAVISGFPNASALSVTDLFGRDVTQNGITLVDWEGPVRNPAMKYYLQGTDALSYPFSVTLSTSEERTSFNLPSTISTTGPVKTVVLDSPDSLASFLFSFYMDENFAGETFDLALTYNLNGLPVKQVVPVTVIDQDRDRPLSYPVIVDFSEAVHPLMVDPATQSVIFQAAEDWLYYVDGESIDEIPAGGSTLDIGGPDHYFAEKTVSNPVPYTGYYLYAFGNSNEGPCVCSTGSPNRELLQTSNGEEVPIFRIGALHLNVFGQAFETEPTGWEVLSPYDNWTQEGLIGADMYTLAKHEIGHAMVFENSPLFLLAQGRDPANPFPDESVTPTPNGFTSPALTAYYPDEVVPLFPNSLSHVIDVLDPASQVPPYGGGVPVPVMPGGREMLTKLDILIMESVGYPLRENEVTKALSLTAEDAFVGDLETDFTAHLIAAGGIPVYDYALSSGALPVGLALDRKTGLISGIPEEEGEFPVTFEVKDYDERSLGATFSTTIRIGVPLSSEAELISFTFDASTSILASRIDTMAHTLHFTLEQGTDITSLIPQIEISERATLSPAAGEPQDFTDPVTYTITSEDGLVSVTWTVFVDLAVWVSNEPDPTVLIYPNPANQELIAEMTGRNSTPYPLHLFTGQGRLVRSTRLFGKRVSIPVFDLPAGLYFLRVIRPDGIHTVRKVVIDH